MTHLPLGVVGSMQVVPIGGLVLDLVPLALIKVPVRHQIPVVRPDCWVVEVAPTGACPVEGHSHALHTLPNSAWILDVQFSFGVFFPFI